MAGATLGFWVVSAAIVSLGLQTWEAALLTFLVKLSGILACHQLGGGPPRQTSAVVHARTLAVRDPDDARETQK